MEYKNSSWYIFFISLNILMSFDQLIFTNKIIICISLLKNK